MKSLYLTGLSLKEGILDVSTLSGEIVMVFASFVVTDSNPGIKDVIVSTAKSLIEPKTETTSSDNLPRTSALTEPVKIWNLPVI